MNDFETQMINSLDLIQQALQPNYLTNLGAVAPLIIGFCTLGVAYWSHSRMEKIHKQSLELEINRDRRERLLKIYDAFFLALVPIQIDPVKNLCTPMQMNTFQTDLKQKYEQLSLNYSRAELLFDPKQDKDAQKLLVTLKQLRDTYYELIVETMQYLNSSVYLHFYKQAWDSVNAAYGIPRENFALLALNQEAIALFESHFDNQYSIRMKELIEQYVTLMRDEELDDLFRKMIKY